MFFILSKILGYLISPLIWGIILIAVYLFSNKRIFLISGVAILLFFSNPFIFRTAISLWEPDIKPIPNNIDSTTTIILLGGYSSYNDESNRIRFYQSNDRLMQSLLLMKKNRLSNLILTGGSPNLLIKEKPEASYIKDYLDQIDYYPDINIHIDSVSRNTYENGIESYNIVNRKKLNKKIILVTSSWHMKRAYACFEKAGFNAITPLNTDPMKSVEEISPNEFFVPSSGVLSLWETLFREWIGILMYYLNGYII